MTQPTAPAPAAPATAHADGVSRTIRSWAGGIVATGLTYGGAGLLAAVGGINWTPTYWKALGLQVAGVVMYGAVSYAMRRLAPPQQ